jgi:hypothetical protein
MRLRLCDFAHRWDSDTPPKSQTRAQLAMTDGIASGRHSLEQAHLQVFPDQL